MYMKRMGLGASGFERRAKQTREQIFLEEMDQVVPWAASLARIEPHVPRLGPKGGRPAFAIEIMLRVHFLQQWFNLSDPAAEEALHDVPVFRDFPCLGIGIDHLPDESTILRFRHLLEQHDIGEEQILATINDLLQPRGLLMKAGAVVDATITAAPSSTRNEERKRGPEMHKTKEGNQWHVGMKMHLGVDVDSGLVRTAVGTAANAHDVTQAHPLLHGNEHDVYADSSYRGVADRAHVKQEHPDVNWHVAIMAGRRRAFDTGSEVGGLTEQREISRQAYRPRWGIPSGWVWGLRGHAQVCYWGLAKNTAQFTTLFALSNLWRVRRRIFQMS